MKESVPVWMKLGWNEKFDFNKLTKIPAGVDGLVAAVVLLPLLEPLNRFDHWPSWAVYTAHPAVVRVYVDEDRLDLLTESARAHVGPPNPFSRWRLVSIERWSLETLAVPIYPQDRFQLGVAIALTAQEERDRGAIQQQTGEQQTHAYHRNRARKSSLTHSTVPTR